MGELPTTDPLSTLLQKHLPPHVRPVRDLSGTWNTSSSSTSSIVPSESHNLGAPATEIPDPFASAEQQAYASGKTEPINTHTVYHAAATNAWRKIATLARTKLEQYGYQESQRLNHHHHHQQRIQTQLVEAPHVGEGVEGSTIEVGQVLQWWSVRLYCLARLRLYSMLRTELAALWQVLSTTRVGQGEEEVMLVDTQHVPFTLRVLRATEPKLRDDIRTTVEQYTLLIHLCKQHIRRLRIEPKQPDSTRNEVEKVQVWKRRAMRVGLMLACTLAEARDYRGAIELLEPVVESALQRGDEVGCEAKLHFVVVAARVWVQASDLETAESLLDRASMLLPHTSSGSSSTVARELEHSRSIIAAIKGDFATASAHFARTGSAPPRTIAQQLNGALVHFYSAQLDESIQVLEHVLDHEPALFASADPVIFNTATLYELAAGAEGDVVQRKRRLLDKVARWVGEPGISSSVLKL